MRMRGDGLDVIDIDGRLATHDTCRMLGEVLGAEATPVTIITTRSGTRPAVIALGLGLALTLTLRTNGHDTTT